MTRCREENWLSLTVSGCIRNILDEGRTAERHWISDFCLRSDFSDRRRNIPEAYWSSVLTPRLLILIEAAGISFEVYNHQPCARQFGVYLACAIPFG